MYLLGFVHQMKQRGAVHFHEFLKFPIAGCTHRAERVCRRRRNTTRERKGWYVRGTEVKSFQASGTGVECEVSSPRPSADLKGDHDEMLPLL